MWFLNFPTRWEPVAFSKYSGKYYWKNFLDFLKISICWLSLWDEMMFRNQAHIVGWNLKSQICWQSLVEMIDWMFALLNFWFSHQTKGAFCLIKLELISLTFWWSSTSHQHYCKPESIAFGSVSMSFGYLIIKNLVYVYVGNFRRNWIVV